MGCFNSKTRTPQSSQEVQQYEEPVNEHRLKIGKNNVFREFVVVHRGTTSMTEVGSENFIMCHSTVNHDCKIGDHNVLSSGVQLAGFVRVGNRVNIGQNSSVHQFVIIGDFAMIGMLSPVTKHVPPFCLLNPKYSTIRKLNIIGMTRNGFSMEDVEDVIEYYQTKGKKKARNPEIRKILVEFEQLCQQAKKRKVYEVILEEKKEIGD